MTTVEDVFVPQVLNVDYTEAESDQWSVCVT